MGTSPVGRRPNQVFRPAVHRFVYFTVNVVFAKYSVRLPAVLHYFALAPGDYVNGIDPRLITPDSSELDPSHLSYSRKIRALICARTIQPSPCALATSAARIASREIH